LLTHFPSLHFNGLSYGHPFSLLSHNALFDTQNPSSHLSFK